MAGGAFSIASVGFTRGESCGVVFYHEERDVSLAVHGDDFTFCGLEEDLMWIQGLMGSWFDIKVRAVLGWEAKDDKEVVILGRVVRWGKLGKAPVSVRWVDTNKGGDGEMVVRSRLVARDFKGGDLSRFWLRPWKPKECCSVERHRGGRMENLGSYCLLMSGRHI